MGSADKAAPFFKLAHGVLKDDAWFVKHEAERLKRLTELGGVTD
jgi:hypothetical protein